MENISLYITDKFKELIKDCDIQHAEVIYNDDSPIKIELVCNYRRIVYFSTKDHDFLIESLMDWMNFKRYIDIDRKNSINNQFIFIKEKLNTYYNYHSYKKFTISSFNYYEDLFIFNQEKYNQFIIDVVEFNTVSNKEIIKVLTSDMVLEKISKETKIFLYSKYNHLLKANDFDLI